MTASRSRSAHIFRGRWRGDDAVRYHAAGDRSSIDDWPVPWNKVESHLVVRRTGDHVPQMFMVRNSYYYLVVSPELARRLERFEPLAFKPVEFQRLVRWDAAAVEAWRWRYGRCSEDSACDVLAALPDVPEFHDSVGQYVEVLAPWLRLVPETMMRTFPGFDESTLVRVTEIPAFMVHERRYGLVTTDDIGSMPLCYAGPALVCVDAVFRVLQEYLCEGYWDVGVLRW